MTRHITPHITPSRIMLTELRIKAAKSKDKPYKLTDEKGLYLQVNPNGSKYFRYDFTFAGKRSKLSFGVYPDTSLKQARDKRDETRKLLAQGIDPRKPDSVAFSEVFHEWVATRLAWSDKYRQDVIDRMSLHVIPVIGSTGILYITHDQLIKMIDRLKAKKMHSKSCAKLLNYTSAVYKYAIAKRLCDRNLAEDVRPLLPEGSPVSKRRALSAAELPKFLKALEAYNGKVETKMAMKLLIWTATRPQETYAAKWCEFGTDSWTIPIERMKLRREHVIPLPKQAITMLDELRLLTGHSVYLFPNRNGCMSENTLNKMIQYMGFDATAHGMRSTFSTIMNEQGLRPDLIEISLAHVDHTVRAVYNRASYLKDRRELMQTWADYLERLSQSD